MTTRLYYSDSYRTAFTATVRACRECDGRLEVTLDQTAFYPTSGGQPHDTGVLGGARVVDVVERDDEIAHVVESPLAVGSTVEGSIAWPRRFDHMQQHTGQHILSASYDRLFGARTESFHLGATAATIDLARLVSPSEILAAEDEANRLVWEDRGVAIRVASEEEAASLPLRKESVRSGTLRLIDIDGFDLSACGGTHVVQTGAIGIIATSGWEKFRGGTRIEFLCGGRALVRFREWRDALSQTTQHLSVPPAELAAGIERLQAEAKQLHRTIRALQEQLAHHQARALIEAGEHLPDRIVVAAAIDGWDAAGLKALAMAAIATTPTAVVALVSRAQPALVVIARGAGVAIDAAKVLETLTAKFGGRGGGKPDLAQGGGLNAEADLLVEQARQILNE
jgi:alanyl-tRNA synthetase